LNAKRRIYGAALKANMPFFESGPHFLEPVRREGGVTRALGGACSTPNETERGESSASGVSVNRGNSQVGLSMKTLRGSG
jgi:hypothetical protein